MAKILSGGLKNDSAKKTRPGVHAKTKVSKSKNSTNYKKAYRGQGR
jgi:hypothetical protein